MDAAKPPLAGIRVLDLTQFLSGPYCTQILVDLGAEVIKLESPDGDLARHIPPYFVEDDSLYYLSINRSKQSIVTDLKSPAGIALARRLIAASDVVVENFRPGVLKKLGLDPAELRAADPRLVWCSISGFGQDGPYRDKPAYDMIVQALSGGMSMTGEPGRKAVRSGLAIGDIAAGMYGAIGVLGALLRRASTGVGDLIDVAMLDCQIALQTYQAAYHLHSGVVPGRQGSGHDSIPTYRTFVAGDGREVVVCANTERMWVGLCRALGLDTLPDDPRFKTNQMRYAAREELWPILDEAFTRFPAADCVAALEREQVPVAIVNDLDAALDDPQVRHRGMVARIEGRRGALEVAGNPLHFAETVLPSYGYPPALGEDTRDVLGRVLGLSAGEIDDLAAAGVVVEKKAAGVAGEKGG